MESGASHTVGVNSAQQVLLEAEVVERADRRDGLGRLEHEFLGDTERTVVG